MAITDIARYTHLSDTDIQTLGDELDAIRRDVEDSRGAADAAYIRRAIRFQRLLDVGARLLIGGSRSRTGWAVGTAALAFAKSVENMELGHNVSHGQWDWMNDPEIHSSSWEWDMAALSSQWRYTHNYRHHVFSNVVDVDDDLGFGMMRVTRDQPWKPQYLLQPLQNVLLAVTFEWGIALRGVNAQVRDRPTTEGPTPVRMLMTKVTRQAVKDYVLFPALSLTRWRRTLVANAVANLGRNLWAYVVIFCGHFPDGTEKFDADVLKDETTARVVPAPDVGRRELQSRSAAGIFERQPVLPDRAPSVSRPSEQPVRRDRRAGAGAVREVRPALHDGLARAAVPADAADHPPTGVA